MKDIIKINQPNQIFEDIPINEQPIRCDECGKMITRKRLNLRKSKHVITDDVFQLETSFKSRIVTYRHNNNQKITNEYSYMEHLRERAIELISKWLIKHHNIKINLNMDTQFVDTRDPENVIDVGLQLKPVELYESDNLEVYWKNQREIFTKRIVDFQDKKGSFWVLNNVHSLLININKFTPLSGSSYIELPEWIKSTKSCINVKNRDNQCFKWSILSALHPQNNQK
ncbi:hypothetical protein QE152_g36685 [Popillia japonica]|uniref:Uncharacterized protein n=1 Tax=Popillia japonica TaxID=7064 RepID=A0AAW1ICR5_POPJA